MDEDTIVKPAIIHTVFYGVDVYCGYIGQIEPIRSRSLFTDFHLSEAEAREDLAFAVSGSTTRGRSKFQNPKIVRTMDGKIFLRKSIGISRILSAFGPFFVLVFQEGTSGEVYLVLGPGGKIYSQSLQTQTAALALAKNLSDAMNKKLGITRLPEDERTKPDTAGDTPSSVTAEPPGTSGTPPIRGL